MQLDNWSQHTLAFLKPHFRAAQREIRIATGYFTIAAYDLIREMLDAKSVYILVGYDETAQEHLRTRLIEAVLTHLRQWEAPNRRAAVDDLVQKLRRGEIQIIEHPEAESLEARLRRRDHAKLFLFDDRVAVVGSANLTVSGLKGNVEAVSIIDDADRIAFWLEQFEHYWSAPDTENITAALIAALEAWLNLRPPFDIYLKTLLALGPGKEVQPPSANYKMPVKYQQVVIERLIRQLQTYRGAMLVASTGLGKTVIAIHAAYRLHQEGQLTNVLVFAPMAVHPDWEQVLRSARIHNTLFTRDLLDQPQRNVSFRAKLAQMEAALNDLDKLSLVIVDESQHFRHELRAKDGAVRHSFRRLRQAIKQSEASVLLLTATPYSRRVEDLNNQLSLLPQTAEPDYRASSGQTFIPGILDDQLLPRAWRVIEGSDAFEQWLNLPVTTIISTSQVARDFAVHTEQGEYVEFGRERRWIPQIGIHKLYTEVPEEEAMREALHAGIFRHKPVRYISRDRGGSTRENVERIAQIAWSSSPAALAEVLQKTIQDSYKVEFLCSPEERQRALQPILDRLQQQSYRDDPKFQTLCQLVLETRRRDEKMLIFTERHATAVYLEETLRLALPGLRVGCTSKRAGSDEYQLKHFEKEVLDLVYAFAPQANADKLSHRRRHETLDVLIVTDAFSAGMNLQDASVVVHYDLAWTPDILIQRAGRILRLWHEPRVVRLYIFLGQYLGGSEQSEGTSLIEKRLARLTERGRRASMFSGLPVVPEHDSNHYADLGRLASIDAEYLGLADLGELEEFDGISPLLRHISILQNNQAYASQLPDDMTSALTYRGRNPLLYLLLRHPSGYEWCVYDLSDEQFLRYAEDRLLALIACAEHTPVASVNADVVEEAAQRVRGLWLQEHSDVSSDDVERICALYLVPSADAADMTRLLEPSEYSAGDAQKSQGWPPRSRH